MNLGQRQDGDIAGYVMWNLGAPIRIHTSTYDSPGLYNMFDTRYGYPGSREHAEDVIYQDGCSPGLWPRCFLGSCS